MAFLVWSVAALAACLYCIVRGVVDLRQKKYVWGVLGIASAAVFMFVRVPSHAVKIDLPIAAER
jgi:hypothetical protein